MAARPTMTTLISRLRLIIGDPASASQVWTDDELQDALDIRRRDVRYMPLASPETMVPGGTVTYTEFFASCGDWEADAALYDNLYNALTPATSDLLTGHWTFAADQLNALPVTLTGKTYDLYAAAADIMEAWVLKDGTAGFVDRREGDVERKGTQTLAGRSQMAAHFRAMARPSMATMVRGDIVP